MTEANSEPYEEVERKLIKLGGSYVVAIPNKWLTFLKLNGNLPKKLRIQILKDKLIIQPVQEVSQ